MSAVRFIKQADYAGPDCKQPSPSISIFTYLDVDQLYPAKRRSMDASVTDHTPFFFFALATKPYSLYVGAVRRLSSNETANVTTAVNDWCPAMSRMPPSLRGRVQSAPRHCRTSTGPRVMLYRSRYLRCTWRRLLVAAELGCNNYEAPCGSRLSDRDQNRDVP